jgi:hypothetical protein
MAVDRQVLVGPDLAFDGPFVISTDLDRGVQQGNELGYAGEKHGGVGVLRLVVGVQGDTAAIANVNGHEVEAARGEIHEAALTESLLEDVGWKVLVAEHNVLRVGLRPDVFLEMVVFDPVEGVGTGQAHLLSVHARSPLDLPEEHRRYVETVPGRLSPSLPPAANEPRRGDSQQDNDHGAGDQLAACPVTPATGPRSQAAPWRHSRRAPGGGGGRGGTCRSHLRPADGWIASHGERSLLDLRLRLDRAGAAQ